MKKKELEEQRLHALRYLASQKTNQLFFTLVRRSGYTKTYRIYLAYQSEVLPDGDLSIEDVTFYVANATGYTRTDYGLRTQNDMQDVVQALNSQLLRFAESSIVFNPVPKVFVVRRL